MGSQTVSTNIYFGAFTAEPKWEHGKNGSAVELFSCPQDGPFQVLFWCSALEKWEKDCKIDQRLMIKLEGATRFCLVLRWTF